jgi:hypothetical protein
MSLGNAEKDYMPRGKISNKQGHNVFILWREMPCRRRLNKCLDEPTIAPRKFLYPGGPDGKYSLNTFLGLDVELKHDLENWVPGTVDISCLTEHIRKVLAKGDDYIYRYLVKWLYEVIIRKTKTNIALLFFGSQGTGKSIFWDDFIGKRVMGENAFYQMTGMGHLVGRFNSPTSGKLLICADEVDARTKHKCDVLKTSITQKTRNTEKKGKDAETVRDFSNLVITTNHSDAIKIEETDRRYFVQEITTWWNTIQEKDDYFNALGDLVDDEPLAAPEFYMWLKNTVENNDDFSKINLKHIPMTQAKQDRMLDDTPPCYTWFQERFQGCQTWSDGDVILQNDLLKMMVSDERFRNVKITPNAFTKMFTTLGFEPGPQGRGRCWRMPPFDKFKANMISARKWNSDI